MKTSTMIAEIDTAARIIAPAGRRLASRCGG